MGDRVRRVVFSHEGTFIAVLGKNRIKIFDAVTGTCLVTFDAQKSVYTIAFSHDDSSLVSGFSDGTVRVLDVQTGDLIQTLQGHTDTVTSDAFSLSDDDSSIVSGLSDGTVRVSDLQIDDPIRTSRGHTDTVISVAFSPCGTMLASSARLEKNIRIWNMSSGSCEYLLEGHSDAVRAVCWSANGNRVVSGSRDATVRIWDIPTRACLHIIRAHTEMVTCVASFQNLIASGDRHGVVKVYDLGSGDVLQTISPDKTVKFSDRSIDSVQFSTHGDKIMYAYWGSASIWDLGRKMLISTIRLDGYHATFSPDGTYVASGAGKFVKIWRTESGYSNSNAVDHRTLGVVDVCFAPDGQAVASRSYEDVKIWDTTSGECLFTFESQYSIGFFPNSAFVACRPRLPSNREWTIWNVRTRCLVKRMQGNASLVALSPDGTRMVYVSGPGIQLWSLATGACLAQLELHYSSRILKIAFHVDGSSILITTDNGYTHSWRISPTPLLNRGSSNNNNSPPFPVVLIPMHEILPNQAISAPSQSCRYERGDEWIVDQAGMRLLWVPPDRRGLSADVHGESAAVGTESGRVFIVDFSGIGSCQ
jgi:WD40 repeat protein